MTENQLKETVSETKENAGAKKEAPKKRGYKHTKDDMTYNLEDVLPKDVLEQLQKLK